jgi:HlyD family secretion protein
MVVGLIAAVGAGVYAYRALWREPADPNLIRVSGNIEATDVEVSFRTPGWIEVRPVSEGKLVRQGDVLALLEDAELNQEVELRDAESAAYKAELAALTAGSRRQEIAAADAAVARAQSEVERARLEFERHMA